METMKAITCPKYGPPEVLQIKPVNDRVYSFEHIVEAHKYVETGHKRGNVAITVNSAK